MTDRPGLEFSFSGLKTAVLTALPANADAQTRADLARAFEEAVTDTLTIKVERALQAANLDRLIVAGGVGANRRLREKLAERAQRKGFALHFPRHAFCTDNAAMIAYAGWVRRHDGQAPGGALFTTPRWLLDTLTPPRLAA